jgi:hypothetical protein
MIFPYTGLYDEFLESYNKIFFCFWKWKTKDFFKTKEAYEYFYGKDKEK